MIFGESYHAVSMRTLKALTAYIFFGECLISCFISNSFGWLIKYSNCDGKGLTSKLDGVFLTTYLPPELFLIPSPTTFLTYYQAKALLLPLLLADSFFSLINRFFFFSLYQNNNGVN